MLSSFGRDLALGFATLAHLVGTLTAGGAGDNTALNGQTIDKQSAALGNQRWEAIAFLIGAKAVLAATKTLVVTAKLQTSDDNTNWDDVANEGTVLTLTGPAGGATMYGEALLAYPFSAAVGRYSRIVVTPNLSAADTDTALVWAQALLGGPDHVSE